MKLQWSERALAGWAEIEDYIAADSPERARAVVEKLVARAESLLLFPHLGRRVPELLGQNFREIVEGNYRIVHRPRPAVIEVVTVFEGHRLFPIDDIPS